MNLRPKIYVKKGEFTLQETLTYLQEKETCFWHVVIDDYRYVLNCVARRRKAPREETLCVGSVPPVREISAGGADTNVLRPRRFEKI